MRNLGVAEKLIQSERELLLELGSNINHICAIRPNSYGKSP